MDSESNVLSLLLEDGDDFGDRVLALGDGQSVSGYDDDVLGLGHGLHGLVDLPFGVSSGDLHRLAAGGRAGAESAENDVGQASVHGLCFGKKMFDLKSSERFLTVVIRKMLLLKR